MNAPPRLLRVPEVAEALAVKPGTIRSWIASRRLPVVRLGRAVRVRLEDVEAIIAAGTVPALREVGQ